MKATAVVVANASLVQAGVSDVTTKSALRVRSRCSFIFCDETVKILNALSAYELTVQDVTALSAQEPMVEDSNLSTQERLSIRLCFEAPATRPFAQALQLSRAACIFHGIFP